MSVLSSIRNRAGLLVAIIGVALLAFILTDLLNSGNSMFSTTTNEVGEISGKEISYPEFDAKVEEAIQRYKQNTGEAAVNDQMKDMIVRQTWEQLQNEIIMGKEYAELGIGVSDDELSDLVMGNKPHEYVVRAFTNSQTGKVIDQFASPQTGQLNPVKIREFVQQMNEQQEAMWVSIEKEVKKDRISSKYNNLIKKGLYVTTSQAKREYVEDNKTYKIRYVAKRYASIADSTIEVSENDLKKYYNEHLNDFKVEETTRKIEYVAFDAIPTNEDSAAIKEDLSKLGEELKLNKKSSEDSTLVVRESDSRNFDDSYHAKGTLAALIDTMLFDSAVGSIYGPYMEGNSFKIAKLIEAKMIPDSINARHVLIKMANPADTVKPKIKADSLKKVINNKNFSDLAKLFSDDSGSKEKGGNLDWFASEGQMVPEFSKACIDGKKGEIVMVKSQYGYHIIEILDKKQEVKKVKVATIERKIMPSTNTLQTYYSKASKFAGKYNNNDLFDKGIEETKLDKRVAENIKESDKSIPGLESPRELVRWTYSAKSGDISQAFELGTKFVIAKLVEIKEKGTLPMEQVKEQVEAGAKKEKKAEKFTAEFAMFSQEKSIENLAAKVKEQVMEAENTKFSSPSIAGLGKESELIGVSSVLKPGVLSKPIKSKSGVYVLVVEQPKEAPAITDYTGIKNKTLGALSNRTDYEVFNALKENAGIKDNRAKFY